MTPPPTNMREVAPPESDVPGILVIQSIVVKYTEEYIIHKDIDVWSPYRNRFLGLMSVSSADIPCVFKTYWSIVVHFQWKCRVLSHCGVYLGH